MTNLYATMVSEQFVLRALALYKSFRESNTESFFVIYCLDEAAVVLLENIRDDSLLVYAPSDYESHQLVSTKDNRSYTEYCWTHKPFILEHALTQHTTIDWAVYLDSDMMAFGNPEEGLPTEIEANVILTPHRPSNVHFAEFLPISGEFNAGYLGFRNNKIGRSALQWWKEQCLEKCPQIPVNGAYADQKYLDQLAVNFSGVIRSQHAGLNAGPWNTLVGNVSTKQNRVFINEDPLLLYHMQGLKIFGPRFFDLYPGPVKIPKSVRKLIYKPYEILLRVTWKALIKYNVGFKQNVDVKIRKLIPILREVKKIIAAQSNLSIRF